MTIAAIHPHMLNLGYSLLACSIGCFSTLSLMVIESLYLGYLGHLFDNEIVIVSFVWCLHGEC